ncbi:MAG TPA: glycosyltransferase family 61 protein, partial [Pyrinomonadaceae bacterium]|nr:glycosyltransferase family 61 protein [Pyrinomonadaceae bacterium]
ISRKAPVNLSVEDEWLFSHEFRKEIPAVSIALLRNVIATPDGLLFRGHRLLKDSFAFPENFRGWKRRSVLKAYVSNLLLRKTKVVEGPAVWVTDDWSTGYFHWISDVLPRLWICRDRLGSSTLLLPHAFSQMGFVQETLAQFKIRDIYFIRSDEVCRCSELYLPSHVAPSGDFDREVMFAIRAELLTLSGDAVRTGRIYISRSLAPKRRVTNESEVIEILEKYGFSVVMAENLSFDQQVKLFSTTAFLVANHGAGLTNMLFMPPGAAVLEFRHRDDNFNNCFFNMASDLDLNYYYQLCTADSDDDPHLANLEVDTHKLASNLELILGRA